MMVKAFLEYESFYCCACAYCFLVLITMGVNLVVHGEKYMHRHNLQLLEHELRH